MTEVQYNMREAWTNVFLDKQYGPKATEFYKHLRTISDEVLFEEEIKDLFELDKVEYNNLLADLEYHGLVEHHYDWTEKLHFLVVHDATHFFERTREF